MKDSLFLDICRNEYHALFEMAHKAINHCPEELWSNERKDPPYWLLVYHTAFYLDFYLRAAPEEFETRFDISGPFDLAAKMKRTLSKKELKNYLISIKRRCNRVLASLRSKELEGKNTYTWTGPTLAHRLVYNVRHAQHHIGQLNLMLRHHQAEAAAWVITPKT